MPVVDSNTPSRVKRQRIHDPPRSPIISVRRSTPTPSVSSPISQLPVELLARIFLFGAEDCRASKRPPRINFEVLVSHVNNYWRSIAVAETRRLWTTINLSDVSHYSRADEYIARSGCMLLDINIDTESLYDHIPGRTLFREEFSRAFEVVKPHISRWRSFVLKVRDSQCNASARSALASCGAAPKLSQLQLSYVESSREGAENFWIATTRPALIIFSGQLPSLTDLSLIGVNIPWAASHSPFIKQLKSLELGLHCENTRPTYDQWEAMLRKCPNLEKLSLHYSGPRVSSNWPEAAISLPGLTELSIADMDPDHLCSVFSRLTLNKVKRLRLELPDQDYTPFINLMLASDGKLLSHIESLKIDSLECSQEAWLAMLRALSDVTILEADFQRLPDGFCETMFHVDEEARERAREEAEKNENGVATRSQTKMKLASGSHGQFAVLPRLSTLRVSGVSGSFLTRYNQFRDDLGKSLERYWVNESCRDRQMEDLGKDGKISWFEDEEDEIASTTDGEESERATSAPPS